MIHAQRMMLVFAMLLAGTLTAGAQDNAAQQVKPMAKDADPSFEVATIKPSDPNDRNQGFGLEGHRIRVENNNMTATSASPTECRRARSSTHQGGSMKIGGTSTASPM